MKGSTYPFKKLEQQTTVNCWKTSLQKCANRNLEATQTKEQMRLFLSLPLAVSWEKAYKGVIKMEHFPAALSHTLITS